MQTTAITRQQVAQAFGPRAAALTDAGIWPDADAVQRRLATGAGCARRREAAGRRYDAAKRAEALRERLAA